MRHRACDTDTGQATVEFALLMPFVAVLLACVIGVTVVCLDVLRTDALARTAARLASVSATPEETATGWVASRSPDVSVDVTVDESTVQVRLTRRFDLHVPLLRRLRVSLPYSALAVAAVEPPPVPTTRTTNVGP